MRAHLSGWPKNKLASKRGQSTCSSLDCIHLWALIGNYQCNSTTDAHSREQEGDHFQTLPHLSAERRCRRHVLPSYLLQLSALSPLCAASFLSNRMLRGYNIPGVPFSKGTHLTAPTYQIQPTTERADLGASWSLSCIHLCEQHG